MADGRQLIADSFYVVRRHHIHDHCRRPAPGGPGIEPRWTRAAKDAVGTSHSSASHVWFTIARGVLTEVYWPTLDRPQVRDLQFLVGDGETFFHDERRHMDYEVEPLDPDALGYRVVQRDREGRYRIEKEIITDPDLSSVIMRVKFEADPGLRLFLLAAPHLEIGGLRQSRRDRRGGRRDPADGQQGAYLDGGGGFNPVRARLRSVTWARPTAGRTCPSTSR